MTNYSKQLTSDDSSGDQLTEYLFGDTNIKNKLINFDRLQIDYRDNSYVLFDHLLIPSEIKSPLDLSPENQKKIQNLLNLKDFIFKKSNIKTKIWIDLYFSKEKNNNFAYILKSPEKISEISLSNLAYSFQKINFYGNPHNKNKSFITQKHESTIINDNREDNSSFSLTKALLNSNATYGFNLDNLVLNKNQLDIYEYLLCEESQQVTPYSSHPNRYFHKNKDKFLSLFKFSQSVNGNLYLINYAKENTQHEDKIRFMKVLDIDSQNNNKQYIKTKDKETNKQNFKKSLLNQYKAKTTYKP